MMKSVGNGDHVSASASAARAEAAGRPALPAADHAPARLCGAESTARAYACPHPASAGADPGPRPSGAYPGAHACPDPCSGGGGLCIFSATAPKAPCWTWRATTSARCARPRSMGDIRAGQAAETARNAAIKAGGTGAPISFAELWLLSRVIDAMAGSDWLTDDFRMCVGEVVLNRVASPEFPDTLYDVVYQKGQYAVVNTARLQAWFHGASAWRLRCVCFWASGTWSPPWSTRPTASRASSSPCFPDRQLGSTYFCLSRHLGTLSIAFGVTCCFAAL